MQVGESLLGVKHAYDLISKVDIFALFLLQLWFRILSLMIIMLLYIILVYLMYFFLFLKQICT